MGNETGGSGVLDDGLNGLSLAGHPCHGLGTCELGDLRRWHPAVTRQVVQNEALLHRSGSCIGGGEETFGEALEGGVSLDRCVVLVGEFGGEQVDERVQMVAGLVVRRGDLDEVSVGERVKEVLGGRGVVVEEGVCGPRGEVGGVEGAKEAKETLFGWSEVVVREGEAGAHLEVAELEPVQPVAFVGEQPFEVA
jgi:hypothetical protein